MDSSDLGSTIAKFPVINPSNGGIITEIPNMGVPETEVAIQRAYETFQIWRKTTAKERSDMLKTLHKLLLAEKEQLARTITLENGKPYQDSLGEVVFGASYCEWYAEECRRVQGTIIASPARNKRMMTVKQPIGVCGLITPWNFPLNMIARKACAALSVGCTVVLKPSEETPLTAISLKKLVDSAGFPPGVFNVITCSRDHAPEVGNILCKHPKVSLISFTGSSATGKILLEQCASTVKKCHMELGGNAPFIVFPSADLDLAVNGAIGSKFRNTGQTCLCPNRFYVHHDVLDEFVEKLAVAMDHKLITGDGFAEGVTQGPLINENAVKKVDTFVQDAVQKGAKIVRGGKRSGEGNNFYPSTLLTGVSVDMLCMHGEIFGPVVAITGFETEEDVFRLANETPYGLAGYAYTSDAQQIWRIADALECGLLGINEALVSTVEGPHGGVKESGIGREGGVGVGIEDFLEVKYLCIGNQ